jgi:hypothetical protein
MGLMEQKEKNILIPKIKKKLKKNENEKMNKTEKLSRAY